MIFDDEDDATAERWPDIACFSRRHILERSGVGATVHYDRVPRPPEFAALKDTELEKRCVLSGGDDYELVFTAPRAHRRELEALARELRLGLTSIGTIHAGDARLAVLDARGNPLEHRGGFDHFAAP